MSKGVFNTLTIPGTVLDVENYALQWLCVIVTAALESK